MAPKQAVLDFAVSCTYNQLFYWRKVLKKINVEDFLYFFVKICNLLFHASPKLINCWIFMRIVVNLLTILASLTGIVFLSFVRYSSPSFITNKYNVTNMLLTEKYEYSGLFYGVSITLVSRKFYNILRFRMKVVVNKFLLK